MINIVNHSVRINDLGLLQFMYPNYIIANKPLLCSDKPIIFTGETKYINQIKNLGINYIFVSYLGEIDMTSRDVLLDIAFSKYNKKVPKYIQEFKNDLDDNLFMELIKYLWVTGKWSLKEYDNTGAFIEFLKSFKTDTYNISKTYLSLLDKTSAEYIETSLLTFLQKVVTPGAKTSKWYKQIIDEYRNSKKDLIEPALNTYIDTKVSNSELRIFNLILNLNKRY